MGKLNKLTLASTLLAFGCLIAFPDSAFAQGSGDVGQVENFIRNVIQAIAGLAGLIATGFFVVGGFGYITSSGNPEVLDRSKRTLFYSGLGLAITVGAFVLSSIVGGIASSAFGG